MMVIASTNFLLVDYKIMHICCKHKSMQQSYCRARVDQLKAYFFTFNNAATYSASMRNAESINNIKINTYILNVLVMVNLMQRMLRLWS